MEATFIKQKGKQKKLILVLIGVILIFLILWWSGALTPKEREPIELIVEVVYPEINFNILESQLLQTLSPFIRISPFEEEIGRENPFIPY